MPRMVRAVADGDRKYAGFDFAGKRRINGEVFEWPNGRGMPEVKRDADGLIISGWVELVSGEDDGPVAPKPRAKIPGLVEGKGAKRAVVNGNTLAPGKSDGRIIG